MKFTVLSALLILDCMTPVRETPVKHHENTVRANGDQSILQASVCKLGGLVTDVLDLCILTFQFVFLK